MERYQVRQIWFCKGQLKFAVNIWMQSTKIVPKFKSDVEMINAMNDINFCKSKSLKSAMTEFARDWDVGMSAKATRDMCDPIFTDNMCDLIVINETQAS